MVRVILLLDNVDDHSKSWIRNGSDSNNIINIHESNILPLVFCNMLLVWLHCNTLPLKTLKLGVHLGFLAHENVYEESRGLQFWKLYDAVKVPPSVAIENLCPQAPRPPSLINWFLSSLAMCWVL